MNNHKIRSKLVLIIAMVVAITLITPSIAHGLPGDGYTGGDGVKKGEETKKDKDKKDSKKDDKSSSVYKGKEDGKNEDGKDVDENGNVEVDEKSGAQKDKESEENAKALNPGLHSPGGAARAEAERKENNPTEEEKQAKENMEERVEEAQEEEKEEKKEVEENKGTNKDPRKNSPGGSAREASEKDAEEKGKIEGKDTKWTLYAQIIMGQAIDTPKQDEKSKSVFERGFEGVVSGIIGDGGVSLDIPYTKFSALNKELVGKDVDEVEGGEKGRDLASYLATYNKYGYFNTVSGNKIASEGSEMIGGFARVVGGIIAFFGLVLYTIISKITNWLTALLANLNPYRMLGFDNGETTLPKNPFSTAMVKFINELGLNGKFIQTLIEYGLLISVFLFLLYGMLAIYKRDWKGLGEKGKQWLVRVVVIFVGLPVLALTASGISKSASEFAKMTQYDDSPAMSHVLDTRAMASGTNLSPDGLKSNKTPNVGAKGDYIDTDYQPSTKAGRDRIADINRESYKRLYSEEDEQAVGFKLIGKWIMANNFNVNTYIADLRSDASLPGVHNYKEAYGKAQGLSDSEKAKLSRRDLEYIMWSGTQNADENLRKPDFKNFNPAMSLGVYENKTFSTQSVALMLQSSFDSSSSKFYAYNFAPKGEQANLKNLTTVKTEWKEITLPGDGIIGAIGSWLSLVSKSLAYVLIATAVIMALFTTTMLSGFFMFFKQAVLALVYGSIHSLLATFLIYLGGIFSVLVAVAIPGLFIKVVEGVESAFYMATKSFVPAGFIDITASLITLFIAYWVSFGGRIAGTGETPVKLGASFFMTMALDFEKRVAEMNRRGATSLTESGRGLGNSYKSQASQASQKMGSRMGQSATGAKQGIKGATKGAGIEATKGALTGFATGNVAGALAGAGKGVVKGAGKGASAGRTAQDGSKQALTSALASKGMSKEDVGDMRTAMKDGNSSKIAKGAEKANNQGAMGGRERGETYDQYNKAKDRDTLSKVNHDATTTKGQYGKVFNPKERLSEQSMANTQELDQIDGSTDMYKNTSDAQLSNYAGEASEKARKDTTDGKPTFKSEEVSDLSQANGENDFVDRLGKTKGGMNYAMNTENAGEMLAGSRFADEHGNVNKDAVSKFQKESDSKFKTGDLSDQDIKDKARLDDAFVMGAKEQYRKPNNNFKNKFSEGNALKSEETRPKRKRERSKNTRTTGAKNAVDRNGATTGSVPLSNRRNSHANTAKARRENVNGSRNRNRQSVSKATSSDRMSNRSKPNTTQAKQQGREYAKRQQEVQAKQQNAQQQAQQRRQNTRRNNTRKSNRPSVNRVDSNGISREHKGD